MGDAAVWLHEPPAGLRPGDGVFVLIRGRVTAGPAPQDPAQYVSVAYGDGQEVTVASAGRGVHVLPAAAAHALAVCAGAA